MLYRIARARGASIFFTVAAQDRRAVLWKPAAAYLIRDAFQSAIKEHPFTMNAFVLLPDHLHCIWTLPENDSDYDLRWTKINSYFSKNCGLTGNQTKGALNRDQMAWQWHFRGHAISDDRDYISHIEYIHYNPVKHGLVKSPLEWPHSTFHRYTQRDLYQSDWGAHGEISFDGTIGSE